MYFTFEMLLLGDPQRTRNQSVKGKLYLLRLTRKVNI